MVASDFPAAAGPLWKTVRDGARDEHWDKPQFFDPGRIDEINFAVGRHTASPTGDVVYPRHVRTRLLHYKYLGAEYLVGRHAELGQRVPSLDYARGFAYQYTWSRERNLEELERHRRHAVRVV
jgi:hypothetical protein